MALIDFKFPDASVLRKIIKGLEDVQKTEPVMARISGLIHGAIEENFREEGRPTKWTQLNLLYAAEKQKERGSSRILQRTGQLVGSLQPSYGRDFARVSTNKEYARIHHFGGTIRPKFKPGKKSALKFNGRFFSSVNIPARPFMTITDGDADEIKTEIQTFIAKKLGIS